MRRAAAIVAGLSIGHALVGLLFWALINVPESTVWMLALSASIAATLLVCAGWIETAAALAWMPGLEPRAALRGAVRGVPSFIVAATFCAIAWWGLGRIDAWLDDRGGEIDAWIIATTGWTQTSWVHRGIDIALLFGAYVMALSLGLAAVADGARDGWRSLGHARWLRRAFRRSQIGIIGASVALLIALPLQAVYWRPASIPTGAELAFAIGKLLVIFVLINTGWALALWGAVRQDPLT